jgi:hypothetical protein
VESERASLRSAENRAEIGAQPLAQGYVRVGEVASPRLTNEVDQLSGRERDPGPDDMVEATIVSTTVQPNRVSLPHTAPSKRLEVLTK